LQGVESACFRARKLKAKMNQLAVLGDQRVSILLEDVRSLEFARRLWPTIAKSKPAISWIEPVLESSFEALEHLFFDAFDVSELAPPSHITVFRRALSLYDKLFHQPQLVRVFFPEMLFANVSSLFLPVLSPRTHRRFKLAIVNDLTRLSLGTQIEGE
jgi:hypothetical protein